MNDYIFIVEEYKYKYFKDYLTSLSALIRFYPCVINKGEKIIVVNTLLDLNYNDALDVGFLNTEQLSLAHIINFIKNIKFKLYDYSISNIYILNHIGIESKLLEYKYTTEIGKLELMIKQETKIYDLAFIVPIHNPRRNFIYNKLIINNIKINVIEGWNDTRDYEIAKCKALLNIHFDENYKIFEEMRCNRWLMSGMTIISESSLYTNNIENNFKNLIFKSYENICDYIINYFKY